LTLDEADRRARLIERRFVLLPDNPAIHVEWRHLLPLYSVTGVQVRDARIAAAMKAHGVTNILTFNTADFNRFAGIVAHHPASI
jgi:predicted nucleic acid-binding protein